MQGRGRDVRVLVVSGVKATPSEDDPATRAQKPVDLPTTLWAFLDRFIAHLLQHIETMTTLQALVFVRRHLPSLSDPFVSPNQSHLPIRPQIRPCRPAALHFSFSSASSCSAWLNPSTPTETVLTPGTDKTAFFISNASLKARGQTGELG